MTGCASQAQVDGEKDFDLRLTEHCELQPFKARVKCKWRF